MGVKKHCRHSRYGLLVHNIIILSVYWYISELEEQLTMTKKLKDELSGTSSKPRSLYQMDNRAINA